MMELMALQLAIETLWDNHEWIESIYIYIHNRIRFVPLNAFSLVQHGHIRLSDWPPSNSWKIRDWSTRILKIPAL